MQIGLVGLPGSGKTTLFNALVRANAETGGYAGQNTANRGTIRVPDPRLERLSNLFNPRKTTFATVEYLDIGGITAGSGRQEEQQGAGGLADLRTMDVLVHVLRCFPDLAGTSGTPGKDFETVELELAIADLEVIERRLTRLSKEARSTKQPDLVREWELLEQCREEIEGGGVIRNLEFSPEDEKRLRGYRFLSQKPVLLVLNIPEEEIGSEAGRLEELGKFAEELDTLALCAKVEMEIAQLDDEDARGFLDELDIEESALSRMIAASYRLLNLISFFTVGQNEVKAWTVTRGVTAPVAAGTVHSDMERGFIRAETLDWQAMLDLGGWQAAKEQGALRVEGKQYVVMDGDVINVRFSV
ncbi:MAG: redox-regulated ATPase YchF [Gemmatimonadetes bacterium]|nr:redox-regulated ATPase YchF [Gemmatimonadota bacterium]